MRKTSSKNKVLDLYDSSAESYSSMMDSEIEQPLYSDILSRLAKRITNIPGPIFDTACGSGHMLFRYHDLYDRDRKLIGMDLSPSMVALTKRRLGDEAKIIVGDMREIDEIETNSVAAVLSFFALHHVDSTDAMQLFQSWKRVIRKGGQLIVATWEGGGPIDYGDDSDVVALKYSKNEVESWNQDAGFTIDRCKIEFAEDLGMDAIYLECTKL